MRARLLQSRGESTHGRRRRARGAEAASSRGCDPAVERAREAGGPIDQASYTCHCGCLFSASVSTSVVCPHCGSGQAW
jgi:hypothetical protein